MFLQRAIVVRISLLTKILNLYILELINIEIGGTQTRMEAILHISNATIAGAERPTSVGERIQLYLLI